MSRRAWIFVGALGASVQAEEAPDLSVLRHYLRNVGRDGTQEAASGKIPETVLKALDRLAASGEPRAHAWKAVRDFLAATAVENAERSTESVLTRMAVSPRERLPRGFAQWELRAAALMDLARAGRLADDVYQEARRALEEELRKALSAPGDGKKPFPRTVDEAARLVLDLLRPDLKDPKELPAPLRREVADLLARLGDKEYDRREAATKRLLEIGEPALGSLRPALDHPDPEVRERVRIVWRVILGGDPAEKRP